MKFFHRGYLTSLVLTGAGLILLGFLLYVKLTPKDDAKEFSAIPVDVNYPSPDLDLMDKAGNRISLVQLHGSFILVNLWATWCPPCKAEMPTLQEYYEKL
jgi:thiol-disulfide isomerase/thioredoxin